MNACSFPDCSKPAHSRDWCRAHYERWRIHGDPAVVVGWSSRSLEDRLWPRVTAAPNGCWIWTGHLNSSGYGELRCDRRARGAHRIAYELLIGPIPDGLTIDHLCRNRACVNPTHMEPVTGQVNILRGVSPSAVNAHKSHCPQGHAYDEANTYLDTRGQRGCRECRRAATRRWRQREGVAA